MIMLKKLPRDSAAVARRMQIARSAIMARPGLDKTRLAKKLGVSRGQLNYYLSGRIKSFVNLPPWAERLYAGCAALGYNDPATAAKIFRELAGELEAS